MISNEFLTPPQKLGYVDQAVFPALAAVCPPQPVILEWRDTDRDFNTDIAEALSPLHEAVLDGVVCRLGRIPQLISYEIDTRAVSPGKVQRINSDWHIDGDHQGKVKIVVADALPTQFLVADDAEAARIAQQKYTESYGFFPKRYSVKRPSRLPEDKRLATEGLGIFDPEPFCLTAMKHHIHRSTRNNSQNSIARVWVRAAILS